MPDHEARWNLALGAGVLLVAALSLGPALWPRPQVPQVTRVALPPVGSVAPALPSGQSPSAQAPASEPPEYPRTASVEPLISGRVNLNTATPEQLEALPRVGPALAARIVEGRPYRSMADLDRVKGIGEATLRALAPLVSF